MNRIMNLYSACVLTIFVRELTGKSHSNDYFPLKKAGEISLKTLKEREKKREREREASRPSERFIIFLIAVLALAFYSSA